MKCYDFDWQINEFMVYCRSTQLRERTMYSYEQTLRLFERWLCDELKIYSVDKVTENMIRKYINDLQERGKYTFFVNDLSKTKNYPDRRRDYRKPVSVTTINNYIRNLRVFFNWLERDYVIKRNPMRKIRQLTLILIKKALPCGIAESVIFGIENHRFPSHYDLHIQNFNSDELKF